MNNTAKIWTDLARNDLRSSQVLYDNGYFRNSYFLFQQSTEKANKALALLSGYIDEKEYKAIQHDQFKIYKKVIFKEIGEYDSIVKSLKKIPEGANSENFFKANLSEYHESLCDSNSFIDSLKNFDLINLTNRDLNYFLRQISNAKSSQISIPKIIGKNGDKSFLNFADLKNHFGNIEERAEIIKIINDPEKAKQLQTIIVNEIIPIVNYTVFISTTFFFCAIITIQHSSFTRYPDNGNNPEKIYTKRLPLVKKQQEFMNFLNEAINELFHLNLIIHNSK